LARNGGKNFVKIFHAEETLQLLDVLGRETVLDFGGVIGRGG
jgi:hypothetical protein